VINNELWQVTPVPIRWDGRYRSFADLLAASLTLAKVTDKRT
jgi:hypothetical protein